VALPNKPKATPSPRSHKATKKAKAKPRVANVWVAQAGEVNAVVLQSPATAQVNAAECLSPAIAPEILGHIGSKGGCSNQPQISDGGEPFFYGWKFTLST
jgi:hypothetical protein